jgi:hypothetical protein
VVRNVGDLFLSLRFVLDEYHIIHGFCSDSEKIAEADAVLCVVRALFRELAAFATVTDVKRFVEFRLMTGR